MNRQEFEARIEGYAAPTDAEYQTIEYVYTWHPVIDPVKGKDQIASIYKLPGGMRIIKDMQSTAVEAEFLDGKIRAARSDLEAAQKQLNGLLDQLHKMAQ